ncbi:MAG: hypothetical protein IKC32_00085 [Clostridia bacterium]|nr:hypothetical protein [Clostridia bacterium]
MEQIYSIPVNEAFDKCREQTECGCPMCVLYKKLQEDELDIILGASMMEPDIRIKTNEQGFCLTHYRMMLGRRRMLGIGLILESHLAEVEKKLDGPVILGDKRKAAIAALGKLEGDCYVCSRIERNMNAMIGTVVYLYESDLEFRRKLKAQPYFCLPHYRALVDYASRRMAKRNFADFYSDIYSLEKEYLKTLSGDVSWFCKKFDYRYDDEPWYNSKDSVKRAIKFLGGSFGEEDSPNVSGQ